jgi:hypothetical protein
MGEKFELLDRDRGAHERDGREAQPMQPDRGEVPLDHDQVLAVLGPMQVEELEVFVEAGRELVLALPLGKVLDRPDSAASISDGSPVSVGDGDADPPGHAALVAEA